MGKLADIKKQNVLRDMFNNREDYYHYTSLSTAWAILENDCLRASHARFSNDSEELISGMKIMKQLVKKECVSCFAPLNTYINNLIASMIDCYIICFCKKNDMLSQWRGYCREDGVSFGFEIGESMQYYFKADPNQAAIKGKLHKVYYIAENNTSCVDYRCLKKTIQEVLKNKQYDLDRVSLENALLSLIPLIKHPGFEEESEYRLVVRNSTQTLPGRNETPLDKLIQYRDDEGVKRPYLDICFGKHYLEESSKLFPSIEEIPIRLCGLSDEKRSQIITRFPQAIVQSTIPKSGPCILVGEAPEDVQKDVLCILDEYKDNDFKIWFEGHLPIRSITVSPCMNQEEVVESFRHYCAHEKYWLKDVDVKKSNIPFRRPK